MRGGYGRFATPSRTSIGMPISKAIVTERCVRRVGTHRRGGPHFRARTILAIIARGRDLQTQLQTQGRVSVGRVYPGDLAREGSARGTILAISKRSSKRREGSAREGSILAISRGKGQRCGLSWRTPNAAPNAGKGQRGNGRAIEQSSHRDTCSG